jgi:chemotaxis methyl-accepting protein methylase
MAEDGTAPGGTPEMDNLVEVMRRVHGLGVSHYDLSFLTKSVEKRRLAAACATPAAYVERLTRDRAEAETLFGSLAIHHSELFRETLTFALLEQRILPGLVARKEASDRTELRIWSAGCAAGQEACSLAILLLELSETRDSPVPFRIFATDSSEAQLALARAGKYDEVAMRKVRLGHLARWFSRQGPSWVTANAVRERVHFSAHDLLDPRSTTPPESIFGEFDLVLCCNLLFYYRPEGRQLILDKLRSSLAPGGYLVTGEAERDLVLRAGGFYSTALPTPVFQRER